MTRIGLTGFELPPEDIDDRDAQESWLLALKDSRLADYARHRLPDELIAKVARAYFQHVNNEHLDGILADSYEEFQDDMRTAREEG